MKTISLGLFSIFFIHFASLSAEGAVTFRADVCQTSVIAGNAFHIQFKNWLTPTSETPVAWNYRGSLPDGLSFDSQQGTLSGQTQTEETTTINFEIYAQSQNGEWIKAQGVLNLLPNAINSDSVVDMGVQTERQYFEFDLNALQTTPAHYSLTGKVPTWLTLTQNGLLTGIPTRAEAGTFTLNVLASREGKPTQKWTVLGVVEKNFRWPKWISESLVAQDARVNQPMTVDVGAAFTRGEEKKFKLQMVHAPQWVQLGDQGILFGTPTANDLGAQEVVLTWTAQIEGVTRRGQTTLRFEVYW